MWFFLVIIAFFFIDAYFGHRAEKFRKKELEKQKSRFSH